MFPIIEPITANNGSDNTPGGDVCADDLGGADNVAVPPDTPLLTTDTVAAKTDLLCADDDPDPEVSTGNNDDCDVDSNPIDQQVDASASVEDLAVLAIPGLEIGVEAANVEAHASCQDGVAVFESNSELVGLVINDTVINIPDGDDVHIDLGIIDIFINETVGDGDGPLADGATSGSVTRRALRVTLSGLDSSLIAEVVVGEATVDIEGDVCPESRIVIKKETAPDQDPNTTAFGFQTVGGLDPANFALLDDGEQVYDDLDPGQYIVAENEPPEPFRVGLVACSDPSNTLEGDDPADTQTDTPTRSAFIQLGAGETVTCIFVNSVGAGEIVCPPGTDPVTELGSCIITNVQCPAGSVPVNNNSGCIITNVQCPDGTSFDPNSLSCVATGGQIVPKGDVEGIDKSPCRASRFGQGFAIIGTNGVDRLTGTNSGDAIFAFGGKDRVSGGRGNDCVEGGGESDKLDGSNGNDWLFGRSGNDIVSGAVGNDRVEGGGGRDNLIGGNGNDTLRGGGGNDKLGGALGIDRMIGGRGVDRIAGGQGRDRISGGPGNDIINVAIVGPPTRVNCGAGKDRVRVNKNELGRIRSCEFVDLIKRVRSP